MYSGLEGRPHYIPDLEDDPCPAVFYLRTRVRAADGILICSPEYARGVPGGLKNALDWLVGGTEIVRKPVALINASQYSVHAHAALTLILETMSADVIRDASVVVPLRGRKLTAPAIAADPALAEALRHVLLVLERAMGNARKPSP